MVKYKRQRKRNFELNRSRMCFGMLNCSGFALIESLIMILVVALCMPVIASCLKSLSLLDFSKCEMQRYNQLYQLRRDLLQAETVNVKNGVLVYLLDQEYQLYSVNGNVIRTPGTVIYFTGVQDCFFYQDQNRIMIKLHQNGREEVWMVGYVR